MSDPTDDPEARRARLDLMAIVSHDLRNPLGSILTGAALIDKLAVSPPEAEKLAKYASIIRRSAERMNRWISDLLELVVIEGGEMPLVRAPVEAAALIRDGVDGFAPMAADKGVRLACSIGSDPGIVNVDRDRILQVLSNLIDNALELTPEGGEIVVSADEVDGVPCFSVRDTGPGIPPDRREKIFDRYWQARRRRGSGAGLGLPIARGLVEAHGGTLEVESTPGAGATFTFRLPRT